MALPQTWGTYQGNIAHTGFSPVQVSPPDFNELWTWQIGLAVPLQQPAAGGGAVFVSNTQAQINRDYSIYAMDVASGTVTWSQRFSNYTSLTAPALYNGNVYFQTVNSNSLGTFLCFSAAGTPIWQSPFGAQWYHYLTPTVDDGVAYMSGGTYGGLYAVNAATGVDDWICSQLPQFDEWTPSLDARHAYVYADGEVLTVDRVTGVLVAAITDPNYTFNSYDVNEAVALSGSMAYVTNGNRLIAFDLAGQRIAWQLNRACTGQVDVVGNVVYVTDAGTLSAFNATSGAFLWAWAPPFGNIADNIVVANNVAFVTDLFTTYAVDLTTHQTVWSLDEGGNLAIADGNLYIAGTTGAVTAVSLKSLQLAIPSGVQIARGVSRYGDLTSIQFSDGQALKVAPGPTLTSQEAPVQVIITGTSVVTSPSDLKLHVQAFANEPNLTEMIDLWNFTSGRWDRISTTSATTGDGTVDATAMSPTSYVDATGGMRARLSWKASGPLLVYPWSIGIDQAVWLEK
ncbi:MAG: outer membrane protein assembly factor BamB family protein [Fimbriimonadaceae bacterium]